MGIDNYDPIDMVRILGEWVEKTVSFDEPVLLEAKKRYRIVTEIIDRFNELNIPIPEDVAIEKGNLERMLNTSHDNRVQLRALAAELSSLMKLINRQLSIKKVGRQNNDQQGVLARERNKKLHVTLPDGTIICEHKAANTFLKAIQLIGVQRVAELQSIRAYGHSLVSTQPNRNGKEVHEVEGNYIETHSNTGQKARFLKLIANKLKLNIVITVLD